MPRRRPRSLSLALAGAALAWAATGAAAETYRAKPSDLAPAGPPGTLRRVIQGFGSWTLVCDEDLAARRRVCNLSQEIVDEAGRPVFNWSLSATRAGHPVMILRRPGAGPGETLRLAVDGAPPASVELATCGAGLCLGFLPVTAALGRAMRQSATARLTLVKDGAPATIDLPLADLATALKSPAWTR